MARNETNARVEQFTDADTPNQALEEIRQENNAVAAADAVIMDAEEALKMIGRIEASAFMATVAEKMIAETAIALKQSKKYKGLPFIDEKNNRRQIATFEEFCQYKLGKSRRRVDELVGNYNLLGPELYEQAEHLGFRQRDYNALKALPADDRQLIAQAIEEENLDKALELMQEMAAKHQRDKEQLTKKTTELTQTLEAKDKVIKNKTGVIDIQAERIAFLENAQRQEASKPVSAEQRLLNLRSNLQITAADIKANVMTRMRKDIKALYEAEMEGNDETLFMAGCLIEIGRELAILRDEYNLPSSLSDDPTPEWLLDTDELPSVSSMLVETEA